MFLSYLDYLIRGPTSEFFDYAIILKSTAMPPLYMLLQEQLNYLEVRKDWG